MVQIPTILLIDTCSIKPFAGETPSGPSYDTTLSGIKCKFEEHQVKFVGDDGKEYVSSGKVFLQPLSSISVLEMDSVITINGVSYFTKKRSNFNGFAKSHVRLLLV